MNISVIGPIKPYKGGISHFNTCLIQELKKHNTVQIISWKRRFPQFIYPGGDQIDKGHEEEIKKDQQFILDILNPLTWFNAAKKINKSSPDQIIFHWVTPLMAPLLWVIFKIIKKKTKITAIVHNAKPHEKKILDTILTKIIFSKVDNFIVHSKEDMINTKKIQPNANVRLGFHPTYDDFVIKQVKQDVRKKIKLKKNVILFFGFVREYKGLNFLIKAMPKVLEKIDCTLLIVGEFWDDKKPYLDLIENLKIKNNVELVADYVPDEDVGNYFDIADIVVLPYLSATQSGIVQLAYAFNKPVITTNVGGLPDVVSVGKTGFLCSPKNDSEISKEIILFYEQANIEDMKKHIKKANKKFSWEIYSKLFETN